MARIKAAAFDERLTLVEHLDELRTRIFISLGTLAVALALCFWQNHLLLEIANGPLPAGFEPLTFSPAEPFMTTLTLSLYGAILLSLPVLLYQLYAFVLPAFTPVEKRTLLPLLLAVPVLFIAGVVFAYYVVTPAAVDFLLNFNADEFNIQVRAREYYSFFALSLIAVGLLFQIPIAILAVTRLGIVSVDQLAKNRRYALLVIAVLAMLLPGTDPITMVISMLPLLVLFEVSLIIARVADRRRASEAAASAELAIPGIARSSEPTSATASRRNSSG